MRLIVLFTSLLMPAVAFLSQRGLFGPDNGTISDQYPTLLVAAGYAFSIWGLIFLLDIVFGGWQAFGAGRNDATVGRARGAAAAGFLLTALWMPVFSQQIFWLALVIIWGSLACMAFAAIVLARGGPGGAPGSRWLAAAPLALHAGWLSLAAILNTAQVIVAYGLLSTDRMLGWSLVLLALALVLLLAINARLRGSLAYVAAAAWGLVGVYMKQSDSALPGADVAAWVACGMAVVLIGQTLWLRMRSPGRVAG